MNDDLDKAMQGMAKAAEQDIIARAKCLSMAVTILEDIATNGGQVHDLRAKASGALVAIAVTLTK